MGEAAVGNLAGCDTIEASCNRKEDEKSLDRGTERLALDKSAGRIKRLRYQRRAGKPMAKGP